MSLDLGTIRGFVTLDTALFDRAYVGVIRKMTLLGSEAKASADGTRALDSGLAGVAGASGKAAAATDVLSGSLRRSAVATTESERATSKLAVSELRLTSTQERLNTLQASGRATTGQLAAAQASLISASDRVAVSQERVGKASGFSSDAWQKAGRTMLIGGGLIAAGFAVAAKEMADFNARMALVQTLSRASSSEMQQLRSAALTAGQAYGFTANQVADAEAELIKAGVSVKNIMGGALTGALTLAAAGQEDVAQATETATIAMTQFGLAGRDVPHIADLLAAGADRALGSVSDLSEALKYGGLAASQAHWSIEQTVGTLAEFAQAGLMGSAAGSTLQQMLRSLEKPSTAAAATMKQYGIEVYNANGTMKSSSEIAGELHDKLSSLPPVQQNMALATMFGARAVRGATILMKDGAAVNEQWIRTVNAQGFAALQASGKMNSLSGDVTKLKSALQSAFIGVGQGANGPLRSIVQDVTSLLTVWNRLPGPVRGGIEALTGVAGAAALVSGAALVLIPKIASVDENLRGMTGGAVTARGALAGLGKAAGIATVIVALAEGLHALHDATSGTGPNLDALSLSLVDFAQKGVVGGELAKTFGANLDQLAASARHLADQSTLDKIGNFTAKFEPWAHGTGAEQAAKEFHALDTSITSLVTSGHADLAASSFAQLSERLHAAGLSTAQITKLFPQYAGALNQSAASAKAAGSGIDQFGNHVNAAGKATKTATQALEDYNNKLKAASDPLFAMDSALQDLKQKQDAATAANRKYGEGSRQAKQANEALFQSMISAQGAAGTLAVAVGKGDVSMGKAKAMVEAFTKSMGLTKPEAASVLHSFDALIGKSQELNRQKPHLKVTADTSAAQHALDSLRTQIINLPNHTVQITVSPRGGGTTTSQRATLGMATGGPVSGPGTSTSDSIPALLSNNEHVWTADEVAGAGGHGAVSRLRAAAAAGTIRGFAAGGSVGGGGWEGDGWLSGFTWAHGFTDGAQSVSAGPTAGAMAAARSSASRTVLSGIAGSVAPEITDPSQLAAILARSTGRAITDQMQANVALAHYEDLKGVLDDLAQVSAKTSGRLFDVAKNAGSVSAAIERLKAAKLDASSVDAAERYAKHLSDLAYSAHKAAEGISGTGKAARAAKSAAEAHARALDQEARDAKSAAEAMKKHYSTIEQAASHAADKAKASYDKIAQAAQNAAQKAQAAAAAIVQSVSTMVNDMISTITTFEAQVSSGVLGDFSFSSIWQSLVGTDDNGNPVNPSLDEFQGGLDAFLKAEQSFAADLQALAKDGASQDVISQILGMGATTGDQLAQGILTAGPSAITALNAVTGTINTTASAAGSTIAGTFYGAGLDSIGRFVAGLEDRFPDLVAALTPMIDLINSVLGPLGEPLIPIPSTGGSGGGKGHRSGGGKNPPLSIPMSSPLRHFASGVRNFGGGLALVGELGPEVVQLPAGSSVYPHGSDGPSLLGSAAVLDRLDRIEAAILSTPEANGRHVGAAVAAPITRAADRTAQTATRNRRAGR